jgi:peptidoglycan/LPS O-acetylase OafA/YrhL
LVPKVSLSVSPSPSGFCLDVRFTLDIEGTAIIGLVIAWFFCFPVAVVLAVLAYQGISERLRQLHAAFWAPVQQLIVAPNYAAPGWQQPPPGAG